MSFTDKGLLLAGDVYIAEINNGVKGPLIGPINVNEITVTPPTTEEKSRISKKRSTFGQALDSVQLPKDPAKAAQDFAAHTGPLQPHFAYGALDKAQYEQAHAMHLANHLSAFDVV